MMSSVNALSSQRALSWRALARLFPLGSIFAVGKSHREVAMSEASII